MLAKSWSLKGMTTQSPQEMHEQIRFYCQRDALHQTINTEFERANGLYPC